MSKVNFQMAHRWLKTIFSFVLFLVILSIATQDVSARVQSIVVPYYGEEEVTFRSLDMWIKYKEKDHYKNFGSFNFREIITIDDIINNSFVKIEATVANFRNDFPIIVDSFEAVMIRELPNGTVETIQNLNTTYRTTDPPEVQLNPKQLATFLVEGQLRAEFLDTYVLYFQLKYKLVNETAKTDETLLFPANLTFQLIEPPSGDPVFIIYSIYVVTGLILMTLAIGFYGDRRKKMHPT